MCLSLLVNFYFLTHFAKITNWSSILVFSCLEIPQFRGPQTVGPVPSAVGVSIAIDKITAAVSSVEDSVSLFWEVGNLFTSDNSIT